MKLIVSSVLALVGCTTSYNYTFQVADPIAHGDTVEDATLKAELQIVDGSIVLDLTNKTPELLQVEWAKISIDRGDGMTTRLRPSIDLGWIEPGAKTTAQLVPFALPHTGDAAAGYEGRAFELTVPVIALRELKTYRFHFIAHVHAV